MNNSVDTNNDHFKLPAPRSSLQNIGEKLDDEEKHDGQSFHAFGKDGFTFLDFLDVINPLQHIPFVGNMYRSITGDDIDPGSRIAGSSLFGGPIGTFIALANISIEQKTGQDIGSHMIALITDQDSSLGGQINNDLSDSTKSSEINNTSNPISAHVEVLEWAQRETSRSTEASKEVYLENTTPQKKKITSNMEVLNWAKEELSLLQPSLETATTSSKVKSRDIKQTQLKEREEALITSNTLGRNQAQLNGAISPVGGWFSETMLFALARYNDSAQLEKDASDERSVESTDAEY